MLHNYFLAKICAFYLKRDKYKAFREQFAPFYVVCMWLEKMCRMDTFGCGLPDE